MSEDRYLTLRAPVLAELPKIKGSRFIGEAFPVRQTDEADERIAGVHKREHSATHHCYAYRMGPEGHVFRTNDDGEPGGTAGLPILRQIDARSLTNVLVVVTRYYGGTKLGTGGLARAYGEAAAAVLDAATTEERVIRVPVRLRFAYDDTAPALQVVNQFDAPVVDRSYTDETELRVAVRRAEVDAMVESFTNALGGRGEAIVEARDAGLDALSATR